MKKTGKRFLATILCLIMCFSLFPVQALADEAETQPEEDAILSENSLEAEEFEETAEETAADDDGTGHVYIYVEEIPADTDTTGIMAHYICSSCGLFFILTEEGYVEVAEEELIIPCISDEPNDVLPEDEDEVVPENAEENDLNAEEEDEDGEPEAETVITITRQPKDADIQSGIAEFSVAATVSPETEELSYQWQCRDNSTQDSDWADIPGANAAKFEAEDFYEYNYSSLQYRCVLTAGDAEEISNTCGLVFAEFGDDGGIDCDYSEEDAEGEIGIEAVVSSEIDAMLEFGKNQLKQPTKTRAGTSCKCAKFVSESARYANIATSVIPNASVASPFKGSNQFGFIGTNGSINYGCQAFTYKDFLSGAYTPQRGDLIFYGYMKSNKSGTAGLTVQQVAQNGSYWHTHVGIIRNNESTKSKIYTIEGNTSGTDSNGTHHSSGYTFNKTRTIQNKSTGYMWSQGKNNSTKIYIMEFIRPAYHTDNPITFSFNANGGSGSMAAVSVTYNNDYALPASGFSYSGYTFQGWNIFCPNISKWYVDGRGWMTEGEINSAGVEKRLYSPSATITVNNNWTANTNGATAFTAYAVWKPNGGSGVSGNISWNYNAANYTLTITGSGQMPDYGIYQNTDPRPWKAYLSAIKTIQIGNGITSIGLDAFQDCTALTTVSLPSSMKTIGRSAFWGTKNLKSITFPEGLESIKWEAFYGSGLTSLSLPSTLRELEDIRIQYSYSNYDDSMGSPFYGCPLRSITVASSNPYYKAVSNMLLTKDGETLIHGAYAGNATITIPDGVKIIGGHAFHETSADFIYENVTTVVLPEGLEIIEQDAFRNFIGLTTIKTKTESGSIVSGYPNSLKKIGYQAFYSCWELTRCMPEDGWKSELQEICPFAFADCSALQSIIIPAQVRIIGDRAFMEIGNDVYRDIYGGYILFRGEPPAIDPFAFGGAQYKNGEGYPTKRPKNVSAWEEGYQQNYGGILSWEESTGVTYWVEFDANGGVGAPEGYIAETGHIPDTIPSRAGYEFLGWATNNAGTTAEYEIGQNFLDFPSAHVTLYAVWNKISSAADDYYENLLEITAPGNIEAGSAAPSGGTAIGQAYERFFSEEFLALNYCPWHFTEALYNGLLERNPTAQETSAMVAQLNAGACWEEMFNQIVTGTEFRTRCSNIGLAVGDAIAVPTVGTVPSGFCMVEGCSHNQDHECNIIYAQAYNPTCTQKGETAHYKCTICGACFSDEFGEERISAKSVTIQPLGHLAGSPVYENEVIGTCIEDGTHEEVVYCTRCNTELSRVTKPTVKGPHSPELRNVILPTHEEKGYSGDTYCLVCGEELEHGHATPKVDASVTIPDFSAIALDRSYLLLKPGDSATLTLIDVDDTWLPYINWSCDNPAVVDLSENGNFTALSEGTAIITASVKAGSATYAATCRVDVVKNTGSDTPIADDVGMPMNRVSLLDTKATVELYRTDYTRIRVVPNLSQNSTQSVEDVILQGDVEDGTGAAVTNAYFKNADTAALFDLRVVDDRTLEIVPKDDALTLGQSAPKNIKGSYTSDVMVVLEGKDADAFNAGTVKLTVKKSLPKVKAAAVKLNSWLRTSADEQPLVFTGGEITGIEVKNADSYDWLTMGENNRSVKYNDAAGLKKSGKLNLLLTVEGWSIKVPVSVSISAASTAPKLKFSPAALTLKPGTNDSMSTTVSFTPALFADCTVTVGAVMEGKNDVTADGVLTAEYDETTHALTVKPGTVPNDAAHTYKLWLKVDGVDAGAVTVKTLAKSANVTLNVKATGTIDTAIPNSPITLTPSWKNYHPGNGESIPADEIMILKTLGKMAGIVTEQFSIEPSGDSLVLTATDSFVWEKGYTYYAVLKGYYGASGAAETFIKLNIKASAKAPAVSLAVKAAGSIDVLRPQTTAITITPTVKNWFSYDLNDVQVSFTAKNGKEDVTSQIGDAFDYAVENGTVVITAKPGAVLNHSWKYSATVKLPTLPAAESACTKTVALKIVQGKAAVTQSTKAVELLKRDKYSAASVTLTPTESGLKIDRVELDAKSAALYDLVRVDSDTWELCYLNHTFKNQKNGTVKLNIFLNGNQTEKANAVLSVKVNIK